MTDLERALAAGGKPVQTDLELALAAGGKPIDDQEPSHNIPVGVRAPEPEMSRLDKFMSAVGRGAHTFAGGASAIASSVSHPVETLIDPAKRRSLERGIDDMVTLGYGQKLANRIGVALGDKPETQLGATEASDTEAAPDYRTAGSMVGAFMPGAAGAIGKGAGKLVGGTLGRVAATGPLAGAGMGAAKALVGYEASAPLIAAGQAAAHDQNPIEAAREAAKDPFGLLVAGSVGAAGGAGSGTAARIRDTKRLSGRTIKAIEDSGGEIRPFGAPARGGLYETPEMTNLPEGRAGINEAAGRAEQNIRGHNSERLKAARAQYGEEMNAILAEHMGGGPAEAPAVETPVAETPVAKSDRPARRTVQIPVQSMSETMGDTPGYEYPTPRPPSPEEQTRAAGMERKTQQIPVQSVAETMAPDAVGESDAAPRLYPATATGSVLDDMEARSKLSSGKVADKKLHSFVQEIRGLLQTETDEIDREHLQKTGEARVLTKPEVPVEDLLKVKQLADAGAEWGSPSTRENAPYRLIHHALTEDAAAVDPRIAELNKRYGQTMEDLKSANDILYGQAKPSVKRSSTKSKSAALKLGRAGDETQAATTDKAALDRLRELDPEYARQLRVIEAKKAAERLRYGEPQVSASFEQGLHRAGRGALPTVGAALGLSHGPLGAAAGGLLGKALANPMAAQVRLGLPLAEYAGRMSGIGPGVLASQLMQMQEQQRRLNEARAAAFTGR